jgi:hypothetical protein
MSLLNKIIKSSLAENKAIEMLHDISYSAINGQRQEFKNYQAEGVIMPGQLNREKPLDAITKEMIEDYHQKEQELLTAPNIVDGRPMKYKGVGYELDLEAPVKTKNLTDDTSELIGDRVYVSRDIGALNDEIKKTDENIKKMKSEMDEFGSNLEKIYLLNNEVTKIENLKKQLKEKNKLYEFIENTIKTNEIKKKDIDKENAIIAQRNKSKLMQYERDLQQINRNRMNLQQQPNESEAQYYQRLKEIEKERYDPFLYKQRALNQNVTELKDKLGDLFEDASFKENIIKNLSDEDKFLLNQSFDAAGKSFLDKYGYNNKSLNPKMVVAELVKPARAISTMQKIFRGNKGRQISRDEPERQRQARQAEQERQERRNRRIAERALLQRTISQAPPGPVAAQQVAAEARERARQERIDARNAVIEGRIQARQAREAAQAAEQAAREEEQQALQARIEQQRRINRRISEREILGNTLAQGREQLREAEGRVDAAAQRLQSAFRRRKPHIQYQDYRNVLQEEQEKAARQRAADIISSAGRRAENQSVYNEALADIRHRQRMQETLSAIQRQQSPIQQRRAKLNLQSAARRGQAMRDYQIMKDLEAVRNRDYSLAQDPEGAALSEEMAALAALSGATTQPQGQLLNPSRRLDLGVPRGTYEPIAREQKQQAAKEEKAAERKSIREAKKAERERLKAIEEEGVGQARRRRKGKGLLRKPRLTKRKLVIKPEEKLKNRLRLVASQIEAGNTNPKLIIEVNDLYKQLYNIDNAYQYLSKNK